MALDMNMPEYDMIQYEYIMIWARTYSSIFEYGKLLVCHHSCHPAQVGPSQFTCGPVKMINGPTAITLLYIIYQLDISADISTINI